MRGWLGLRPVARRRPPRRREPPEPTGRRRRPERDLEPTIYRFILRHSLRQQLSLLALTLVSFPFLYSSLDLPKTIVNRAIGGKQFPQAIFRHRVRVKFRI